MSFLNPAPIFARQTARGPPPTDKRDWNEGQVISDGPTHLDRRENARAGTSVAPGVTDVLSN
jgi:hypothetical protein